MQSVNILHFDQLILFHVTKVIILEKNSLRPESFKSHNSLCTFPIDILLLLFEISFLIWLQLLDNL